jgi:D-Tyr-tRNAtyr deacylase
MITQTADGKRGSWSQAASAPSSQALAGSIVSTFNHQRKEDVDAQEA